MSKTNDTEKTRELNDTELNDRELDGVVGGLTMRDELTRLSQTANPPGGSGSVCWGVLCGFQIKG